MKCNIITDEVQEIIDLCNQQCKYITTDLDTSSILIDELPEETILELRHKFPELFIKNII